MSDAGFYSSLYDQINECAVLIDSVLMNLKEGKAIADSPNRERIFALFDDLAASTTSDLSTRLVSLIIRDKEIASKTEWAKARKIIESSNELSETSFIPLLEKLAVALEQEQAGALARTRGGSS